jgi:hypothetical protein
VISAKSFGEFCKKMKASYGIQPGISWGTAPNSIQNEWEGLDCDNVMEGKLKLPCKQVQGIEQQKACQQVLHDLMDYKKLFSVVHDKFDYETPLVDPDITDEMLARFKKLPGEWLHPLDCVSF